MGQGWPHHTLQFTLGASVVTQAKGDLATLKSCCEAEPYFADVSLAQLLLGKMRLQACLLFTHSHRAPQGPRLGREAPWTHRGSSGAHSIPPQGWPGNRVTPTSPTPSQLTQD